MITTNTGFAQNILPIWQPIGYSTYQIANCIAQKYRQKVTHTGVLDPLAEGVIIVLIGEERFNKQEHTSWLKEYEFEMTFGVETDSHDGMGITQNTNYAPEINIETLQEAAKKFIGAYLQKVPLYSAQKVAGKKLFMYPKFGQVPPELPTKTGYIHKLEILDFRRESLHAQINQSIESVKKIKRGEFRQEEIISNWEKFINENEDVTTEVVKFKVVMTRGLYVRSLCNDLALKLGKPAYVSQLIRTKNGSYTKSHCKSLEDVFGKNFDMDNLTSRYATLVGLWNYK